MFATTIEWHETAVELPATSGEYLVVKGSGRIGVLPYSSRHEYFNAHDRDDDEDAKDWAIPCKWWANVPEMPETESEDE